MKDLARLCLALVIAVVVLGSANEASARGRGGMRCSVAEARVEAPVTATAKNLGQVAALHVLQPMVVRHELPATAPSTVSGVDPSALAAFTKRDDSRPTDPAPNGLTRMVASK